MSEKASSSDSSSVKGKDGPAEPMVQTIGRLWKRISPEELQRYNDLAEEDSKRYRREMDEYNRGLVEKQVQLAASQRHSTEGRPVHSHSQKSLESSQASHAPFSFSTFLQNREHAGVPASAAVSGKCTHYTQAPNSHVKCRFSPFPSSSEPQSTVSSGSNLSSTHQGTTNSNSPPQTFAAFITDLRRQNHETQRRLKEQLREQQELEAKLQLLEQLCNNPLTQETQHQVFMRALQELLGLHHQQQQRNEAHLPQSRPVTATPVDTNTGIDLHSALQNLLTAQNHGSTGGNAHTQANLVAGRPSATQQLPALEATAAALLASPSQPSVDPQNQAQVTQQQQLAILAALQLQLQQQQQRN